MKLKRLGLLTITGIIFTITSALLIAISAFARGGSMFSPGALNAKSGKALGGVSSHAETAGNCNACHSAPWETDSMDERCLRCHQEVAIEMQIPSSVHSRMMQIDPNAKCRTCHPEHKGSEALPTVLEGWRFPHDVSRFSLKTHQFTAGNKRFLCVDCHGKDVTQFDQLTCSTCHVGMDVSFMTEHLVAFGADCLACHDGLDRYGKSFDHDKFTFKLSGQHSGVNCSQCHVRATTVTALQSASQMCISCHAKDDPHQGRLGAGCSACHSPDGWRPSSFDHGRSDFKLTGAHGQVPCGSCHMTLVFKDTPKDCFSCHKQIDPHMGQFGAACESCHGTEAWMPAHFDHDMTGFKLIGSHKFADCKSCHINGAYKNTPTDCFACHARDDAHGSQLGTNCAGCHIPTVWTDSFFDHNQSAFPLTGQHRQLACSQCHRTKQYKIPTDCVSCHGEPDFHKGAFGTNCVQCHTTSNWSPALFIGTHFTALGQNFLDHHGATCQTCHTKTVHEFTCLACHATNPLDPNSVTPVPVFTNTPVATATLVMASARVVTTVSPSNIQVHQMGSVTINLNNIPAQGYTSTEFTCTYDPVFITVSDISVGDLFGSDSVSSISDSQNGIFILAIAGSKGQRASGHGAAFTFHAQALQAGQTNLECKARISMGQKILQSIESLAATVTLTGIDPTVTNIPAFASLTGQVLAGKPVTVRLYNLDNSIAATTSANPDGTFSIKVPEGTYTITASAEGYLGAQGSVSLANGNSSVKSVVSLIAGDVDNNGVINQMDAFTIRINYNSATPTAADLNSDGVINVLDLGMLAENYGQSGLQAWP